MGGRAFFDAIWAAGTRDFTRGPAMTLDECAEAIRIGVHAVRRLADLAPDLVRLEVIGKSRSIFMWKTCTWMSFCTSGRTTTSLISRSSVKPSFRGR
ncbi:nicotinate-nucleotide--dimethylbenzimidazole phosphoribosyltransferase [Alicyclobacillus acidocaldarius]|uniref:nicotinate-nucleotide--dimethylbenzimidazole phosphoribosyltransferase n=1 Tax=Alicyclobacillus acidocaldarius TaxID=405212 RepID=UPI00345EF406